MEAINLVFAFIVAFFGLTGGDDYKSQGSVSGQNAQRSEDVSRIVVAANEYQVNNGGKAPFRSGINSGNLSSFVERYIDDEFDPDSGNCSAQFQDPDGECYAMSYLGSLKNGVTNSIVNTANIVKYNASITSPVAGGSSFSLKKAKFDHVIYTISYALCGDDGKSIAVGAGEGQFAVFYIGEGGYIMCDDNH